MGVETKITKCLDAGQGACRFSFGPMTVNLLTKDTALGFGLFIFFSKIYLFICRREREHKQGEQQAEAEGEAGSLWSKEPAVGLDPRTLGS